MFANDDWLNQHNEEVIDPTRAIIDPHHHLWPGATMGYDLPQLFADTSDGHNIVATVFMGCGAAYRKTEPAHLKAVGETEFVAAAAKTAAATKGASPIAGIVAHADMRLAELEEVLEAHETAAKGLLRGIRHGGAHDPHEDALSIKGPAEAGLFADADFRRGVAGLGARGLVFDSWFFHHQIDAFRQLAEAAPDTILVIDHFGMPLGVGPYAGKRQEIFDIWQQDIAALAACPNVYAKLGGLAMPDMGFGWNTRAHPAGSDELAAAHAPYYHHTIEQFGPARCMLESNFPVDRLSISYRCLWNGLKKIVADYSEDEKQMMFTGTAKQIYRLEDVAV